MSERVYSDVQIAKVQDEFDVKGYRPEYIAAVLILQARAERNQARRQWQRVAVENARLRHAAHNPTACTYQELSAQNVAERIGFANGVTAGRMYEMGHADLAPATDSPRLRKVRNTLADLLERVKARLGDS